LGSPIDIKLLSKDIKNSRVILGKKQVQPNPFDILKAFSVGDIVVGKVIRIVNYGAFIKINKRLDGLLHASQFDSVVLDKKNNDIKGFNIKSNTIRPDEYIKAIIIKIDTTNFKVSKSVLL
jgi:ribosomal protein S1